MWTIIIRGPAPVDGGRILLRKIVYSKELLKEMHQLFTEEYKYKYAIEVYDKDNKLVNKKDLS